MAFFPSFGPSRIASMQKVLTHFASELDDCDISSEFDRRTILLGSIITNEQAIQRSPNNPFLAIIKEIIITKINDQLTGEQFNELLFLMMKPQNAAVIDLFLDYTVKIDGVKETPLTLIVKQHLSHARSFDPKKLFSFGEDKSWLHDLSQHFSDYKFKYIIAKNICICANSLHRDGFITTLQRTKFYDYATSLLPIVDFFEDVDFDELFIEQLTPDTEEEKEILANFLMQTGLEKKDLIKITDFPYYYFPRALVLEALDSKIIEDGLADEELIESVGIFSMAIENVEFIEDLSTLISDDAAFFELIKKAIIINQKSPLTKTEFFLEHSPIHRLLKEKCVKELDQLFSKLLDHAIERKIWGLIDVLLNELISFHPFNPLLQDETLDRTHPYMTLLEIILSTGGVKVLKSFKKLAFAMGISAAAISTSHTLALAIKKTFNPHFSHPLLKAEHHLLSPRFLEDYKKERLPAYSYPVVHPFMYALIAKGQSIESLARAIFPSLTTYDHEALDPLLLNFSLDYLKDSFLSFKPFIHLKPCELFICYGQRLKEFFHYLPSSAKEELIHSSLREFTDYLENQAQRKRNGICVLDPTDKIMQTTHFLSHAMTLEEKKALFEDALIRIHQKMTGSLATALSTVEKTNALQLLEISLQEGICILFSKESIPLTQEKPQLFVSIKEKIKAIQPTKTLNWPFFYSLQFLHERFLGMRSFKAMLNLKREFQPLIDQGHILGNVISREFFASLIRNEAILSSFDSFLTSYLSSRNPQVLEELKAFKTLFPTHYHQVMDRLFLTHLQSSKIELEPKAFLLPESSIDNCADLGSEKIVLSNQIFTELNPRLSRLIQINFLENRPIAISEWVLVENLLETAVRFSSLPIFKTSFELLQRSLSMNLGREPAKLTATRLQEHYATLSEAAALDYCKTLIRIFSDSIASIDIYDFTALKGIVDKLRVLKMTEDPLAHPFSVLENFLKKKTGGFYSKDELIEIADQLTSDLLLKNPILSMETDLSVVGALSFRYKIAFSRFIKLAKEGLRTNTKREQLAIALSLNLIAYHEKSMAALAGLEAFNQSLIHQTSDFHQHFFSQLLFIDRIKAFDRVAKGILSEINPIPAFSLDYTRQRFATQLGILKADESLIDFPSRQIIDRHLSSRHLRLRFKEEYTIKILETLTSSSYPFFKEVKESLTPWHLNMMHTHGHIPCFNEKFMTESGKTHGFNRGMRASLFLQFN